MINGVFADWAGHEVEGNAKCAPPMLDELLDAIGVESMSACQFNSRLSAEFVSEADGAEIIFEALIVLIFIDMFSYKWV